MAASSRIFISYRRDDAPAYAGRLYDALDAKFPGQVFMDIDTLEPGIDFVERIEESVGSADVLVAVIGRGWVGAVDKEGRRRLDQPDDFVRLEVSAALKRNIRVIPVLVGGAPFPEPEELPDDLAGLRRRSGLFLSDLEWKAGTHRLVDAINHVLGVADAPLEDKAVQQVVDEARAPPVEQPGSVVGPDQSLPAAVLPLVIGGAVLLAVGLFMRWDNGRHSFVDNNFGRSLDYGGAFTSLAPIGVVVAAVLGALLARKPSTRALGAGVLVGAGIAGVAKYVRVLLASGDAGAGAMLGVLGALAGGVLVLVAGVLAVRATRGVESPRCVTGAITGITGAAVMVVAIAIPFNGGGSDPNRGPQKVARAFNEAFDPVVTSVAIAVVAALLLRPWRHLELSAALLTLGCLNALLWVRYLGVPLFQEPWAGTFGAGGVVGLIGAGLVLLGGYLGIQGSRASAHRLSPSSPYADRSQVAGLR